MARLAKASAAPADVRAHLAERFRVAADRYEGGRPRVAGSVDGGVFVHPAQQLLQHLESGDPVVVQSFYLPPEMAAQWRHQRVVVEPDGSVHAEDRT